MLLSPVIEIGGQQLFQKSFEKVSELATERITESLTQKASQKIIEGGIKKVVGSLITEKIAEASIQKTAQISTQKIVGVTVETAAKQTVQKQLLLISSKIPIIGIAIKIPFIINNLRKGKFVSACLGFLSAICSPIPIVGTALSILLDLADIGYTILSESNKPQTQTEPETLPPEPQPEPLTQPLTQPLQPIHPPPLIEPQPLIQPQPLVYTGSITDSLQVPRTEIKSEIIPFLKTQVQIKSKQQLITSKYQQIQELYQQQPTPDETQISQEEESSDDDDDDDDDDERIRKCKFKIERLLGSGGFGKVSCIVDIQTNERFSIKEFYVLGAFQKEFDAVTRYNHPNIVKYEGIITCTNQNTKYLLLEKCDRNLKQYYEEIITKQRRVGVEDLEKFMIDISQALFAFNQQNDVHRDLRDENILHNSEGNMFILGDLGNVKQQCSIGEFNQESRVCNMSCIAPEIRRGEQIHESSDMFSLGEEIKQFKKFVKIEDEVKNNQINNWIQKLTDPDPRKRLNIKTFMGELEKSYSIRIIRNGVPQIKPQYLLEKKGNYFYETLDDMFKQK